jgi:ElaB/YqjD/DUF883 family membrane-anchored ribosome-binding protein
VRAKITEVKDSMVQRIHDTDQRVHDNAWKLMGTAAQMAFAAGLLVATRRSDRHPAGR